MNPFSVSRSFHLKALITLCLLISGHALAQGSQLQKPSGEFATIDVKRTVYAMLAISNGPSEDKHRAIRELEGQPELFAPPAFFALSNELAKRGDLDKALFWYYAAQLRANFDGNRCSDRTARDGASMAFDSQMNPAVRQHQIKVVDRLEKIVRSVIDWDRTTQHNYDHRWISTYGSMAAWNARFGKPLPEGYKLSIPEDQWDAVLKRTQDDWLNGFLEALPMIRKTAEQAMVK